MFMIACSATVKRQDGLSYQYKGEKYSKVYITIDSSANRDPDDLERFEEQKLQEIIMFNLEEKGLIEMASQNVVKVVITDLRLRSAFNAYFWGVMAGDDHIVGDVSLVGNNDQLLNEFKVSAYYAFGGGVLGSDEMRMNWLYKEFSNRILSEIKAKK
jgi:hypothetical protein